MNQVLTEPAPPTDRRVPPIARGTLVVIVSLAMIGVGLWLVQAPSFVDHVDVKNSTGYDLSVDVTGAQRDGWLPISVATGGDTNTVTKAVVDQGDTWIFRFSYAGREAGELRVPRAQLERHGWQITVPTSVADDLRNAGVLPGP
ncbi:MAG TPA: hypothetical protein VH986_06655 [Acidimicrobiia bacterium]|jgi:hypothetical protein